MVTNTLADRDQLIGQVVTNLNTVLGTFGGKSDKLDKAVVSPSELVDRLAQRKTDIRRPWPTPTRRPTRSPAR